MLKQVIAATNNAGKLKEFQAILSPLGFSVISMREAGISADPEENGTTFAENAKIKATAVAGLANLPALADDSGLCVDALGGEPGIYTARFGGEIAQSEKNALLLRKLDETGSKDRTARFVSAICLAYPDGSCVEAEGTCEGSILYAPDGENGFGYDPIFADFLGRSFGRLSAEEKNRISHRAVALAALAEKLKTEE